MNFFRTLSVAFLLSTSYCLFGQGFQPSLKLYTNFQYVSSDPQPRLLNQETSRFRLIVPTPAVQWFSEEKWAYHEIELSNFRLRNIEEQLQNTREVLVGGRYEYGRVLDINIGEKWLFFLGGSARLFFYDRETIPNVNTRFEEERTDIKVILGAVPRVQYRINDRFSVDLNLIIDLLSIGNERRYTGDPTLSLDSRTRNNFSTEFFLFGDVTTRLGVVYHL